MSGKKRQLTCAITADANLGDLFWPWRTLGFLQGEAYEFHLDHPDIAFMNKQMQNTACSNLGIEITEVGDNWVKGTMPPMLGHLSARGFGTRWSECALCRNARQHGSQPVFG